MDEHGIREWLDADLGRWLRTALTGAMENYVRFCAGLVPEEPKEFLAYQAACRAALAHIQLLLKLAGVASQMENYRAALDEDEDLQQLISQARVALETFDGGTL